MRNKNSYQFHPITTIIRLYYIENSIFCYLYLFINYITKESIRKLDIFFASCYSARGEIVFAILAPIMEITHFVIAFTNVYSAQIANVTL